MVLGTSRATQHSVRLPASDRLPELTLGIQLAKPPMQTAADVVVLYVLDPEPLLFGAAALFAYGTHGYFAGASDELPEHTFGRLQIVGVGHVASDFAASAEGWDNATLRQLRRRDFPPFEHPSIRPGRAPNAHADRFACSLVDRVMPHVEGSLLGLTERPRRALLGASYSAVMALQVLLSRPGAVDDFVLGSPSVCFDPEILVPLAALDLAAARGGASAPLRPGAFVAIGAEENEPPPEAGATALCSRPGNVHRGIPDGARELASVLRDRGVEVDGVHEFAGEDHTSMKLSLVSRGLMWLARRAAATRRAS